MARASRPARGRPSRFRLNSDGQRHPLENVLSVVTLTCGLVAFVSAFFPSAHAIGAWLGTVGFLGGLYSQYVSATTPERALNIVGIVASFVGVALGIYHGGYYP
ncbi:hypothetical protein [Streptosporangium sp. NPDC000396]|uniref:hypothetical protein n=1 Tax=Streptosporangium sp. NPDC000396 TaxID=3366185 RepID=UPI0036B3168C